MPVTIEKVTTASGLEAFVNLPFQILDSSSNWVPPLKKDEKELLTPGQHPFWDTARRELFIARRDGTPIGRIAAIVDEKYNEYARLNCGAFGFFECAHDFEAAHLLLAHARSWLVAQGMTFMRGPLNPSTNYTCGLLVSGFEKAPAIMTPWNPEYYPELLESWYLRKEQDLFAYVIERGKLELAPWLMAELARIKSEHRFTFRSSGKKTLAGDVRAMLRIYAESWAQNWGFSPLSPAEADKLVKDLTAILDPEFFVLFFHGDEPAAGMVALPDLNPLLKRLKGKVGPTALWHFWRSRSQVRRGYRIILFGILPQYRLYGLPLLLLDHMLAKAAGMRELQWVEGSWVLEDNTAIDDLIEDFGGVIARRYRIYRREIGPC